MAIPTNMRYVAVKTAGAPGVMRVAEGPTPQAGPDDVLIEVAYAGVNRPDCAQRAGTYPPPPDASPILGLEVAGRIVSLGANATGWNIGDSVCALTPGGGYAEYCTTPAAWCLPVPAGWSLEQAAGIPENYFTVWNNVFDRAKLIRGEWFLVHGGTSGIGLTAIQLAKAFGATVFTTVRNQEKAQAVRALGADHAVLYKDNDWAGEVKSLSGGRGVDVVLDMVAGDYVAKNLQLLKPDGRNVVIAVQGGAAANINVAWIMMNRITLTGSTMRPQSIASKARMARGLTEQVWPLLEAGKVSPVIHKIFAWREAAAAHAELERADHVGKVMLTLD